MARRDQFPDLRHLPISLGQADAPLLRGVVARHPDAFGARDGAAAGVVGGDRVGFVVAVDPDAVADGGVERLVPDALADGPINGLDPDAVIPWQRIALR